MYFGFYVRQCAQRARIASSSSFIKTNRCNQAAICQQWKHFDKNQVVVVALKVAGSELHCFLFLPYRLDEIIRKATVNDIKDDMLVGE